ncbi:hypothetical protein Tco_0571426 [Tanacetum coccineum]
MMMMMMSTVVATAVVTGIMAGVSDGGGVWRRMCMAEVVYGGGGVWRRWCLGTKPQPDQAEPIEDINLNVVTRSNGQKRYFSTLTTVLSIFDREDLNAVYQLVMDKYQDEMPEGFERVLWGDLMVLFKPDEQDEFWNSQHKWNVISWKLHSSSGVHTLMTEEGLVIHMLIEKKYPLKKEIVVQMLKLKLESEEESTMALELIRFIKKGNQLTLLLGKELASPRSNSSCMASPNSNDEELSIPEQTATGKGTSNPLMAGSLPKTTKPTFCFGGILMSDGFLLDEFLNGLLSIRLHSKHKEFVRKGVVMSCGGTLIVMEDANSFGMLLESANFSMFSCWNIQLDQKHPTKKLKLRTATSCVGNLNRYTIAARRDVGFALYNCGLDLIGNNVEATYLEEIVQTNYHLITYLPSKLTKLTLRGSQGHAALCNSSYA